MASTTKCIQYADLLDKAADLLPGHWTQGSYVARRQDGSYAVCLVGAIGTAELGRMDHKWYPAPELKALLYDYLEGEDPEDWNDAPDRTEAEVIMALRTLAQSLREGTVATPPFASLTGTTPDPSESTTVPSTLPWPELVDASR